MTDHRLRAPIQALARSNPLVPDGLLSGTQPECAGPMQQHVLRRPGYTKCMQFARPACGKLDWRSPAMVGKTLARVLPLTAYCQAFRHRLWFRVCLPNLAVVTPSESLLSDTLLSYDDLVATGWSLNDHKGVPTRRFTSLCFSLLREGHRMATVQGYGPTMAEARIDAAAEANAWLRQDRRSLRTSSPTR